MYVDVCAYIQAAARMQNACITTLSQSSAAIARAAS